jgi:hypothetical protein
MDRWSLHVLVRSCVLRARHDLGRESLGDKLWAGSWILDRGSWIVDRSGENSFSLGYYFSIVQCAVRTRVMECIYKYLHPALYESPDHFPYVHLCVHAPALIKRILRKSLVSIQETN